MEDARIVVQGFGKVGAPAAYLAQERGATVIAISDVDGGIYNARGLDIQDVRAHFATHKTLTEYPKGESISNAELLELDCDVLMPCAMENQITAANAPRVKARIIAEGANGPLTPDADELLLKKGVFIIPDILCNAGGVTVSYFEWVQDLQSFFWGEEEINERLRRIMVRSFNQVMLVAQEKKLDMRTAAQVLGIQRVAEAMRWRGIYP
jgi:glutamate dehydrogenase (NAD(P)+)